MPGVGRTPRGNGEGSLTTDDKTQGSVPVPYATQGEAMPAHTYYYPDYAINQGDDGDGLQLARLGKLLWKHKLWIVGAVGICLAAGWAASRLVTPEYMTSTSLAIQDRGTDRGGPIQTGAVLPVDGWTDVFVSRAVVAPVVDDLGLQLRVLEGADRSLFSSFRSSPQVQTGEYVVTVQDAGAWTLTRAGETEGLERGPRGGEIGASSDFSWNPDLSAIEPGTEIRFRVSSTQAAVRDVSGRLVVRNRQRSDIINAELTWHDPYEAADVLNALTAQFVLLAEELKTTKIREEVQLLEEQANLTGSLLQQAEFSLEAHRVDAITEPTEPLMAQVTGGATVSPGTTDPAFGAFQSNKVRADALLWELQQLEAIRGDLASGGELNILSLQMVPSASQYSELQSAVSQLQQARLNRRTLGTTYTEAAPEMVAVVDEIANLEATIIPTALDRLSNEVDNQVDLLNRQIEAQGDRLREIPQRTILTARLQREVGQAASLHSVLLSRLKEAELAEATSGPGITILNQAWPNPSPLGEKPGGVIALFGLLGLGLGIAGILVFDRFDRRIHSPDQVTGSLGLPVLAVVPRLQAAPDPSSPTAAIAVESFRGLRTQIAHVDGNANGVLLITSPAPREGKSMVSANLAISYATAGHRTLLLDGDTRRGRAQEMFNLDRSPGLTDYLMDRATLDEVLQATNVENLTLLARGAPGGFNADLLEGRRMNELMTALGEEYDSIVIDGPPLAAGADVLLLGSVVDKVVFVVRAGTTTEDLAKAKLEALGNVDLPIVGAVLNALPKSAPDYEYYVNYYYADAEAV